MQSAPFDQKIRRLGSVAAALFKDSLDGTSSTISRMGELIDAARAMDLGASLRPRRAVPCCPPEPECCPPRCMLQLTRQARPGEVILVPFRIRNLSNVAKRYAVGVRPMMKAAQAQLPAPSQPSLDKTQVSIDPGQAALVEMRVDLSKGYQAGEEYEATVVVREEDVNQNICFRLILVAGPAPEAIPCDEKQLKSHFVSWQYHFYCDEPGPPRAQAPKPPPAQKPG